ncbi:MAG TPA: flagellar basal body P-ring formation chaperone FlgA [Burkholderiaceae bacterium]
MNTLRLLAPISALAAFAALPACFPAQAEQLAHAGLRSEARVEGRSVTLGDIAELSGASSGELATLARLRLAPAPEPGYTLHLTRKEVNRLLHEVGAPALALDGADSIVVTTATNALDMDAVIETGKGSLTTDLQRNGRTVELTPQDGMQELRLPRGEVTLRARKLEHRELRSRMTVQVDVLLDGGYYRTVPVTFSVSVTGPAYVARKDLPKGAVPNCGDVELQQRELAALASAPQDGDCSGWQRRMKRNLAVGEVLLAAATETLPTVSEGQYVTLKVAEGAVLIESRALALTDGEIGQRIAVRPATSEEPVLATVVGPGLVNLSGR